MQNLQAFLHVPSAQHGHSQKLIPTTHDFGGLGVAKFHPRTFGRLLDLADAQVGPAQRFPNPRRVRKQRGDAQRLTDRIIIEPSHVPTHPDH